MSTKMFQTSDMPLEKFITKAELLVNDGGYDASVKGDTLGNPLVFGLRSDKVCNNAVALGNTLAFNWAYNVAKIEEITKAQKKSR